MATPKHDPNNPVDRGLRKLSDNIGGDGSPTVTPHAPKDKEPSVSLGDVRKATTPQSKTSYVLRDIGEVLGYASPSGFVGCLHVDDKTYARVDAGPPCATAPPKAVLRALRRSTKPGSDVLAGQVEQHIDYLQKQQQEEEKTRQEAPSGKDGEIHKAAEEVISAVQEIFDQLTFPPRVVNDADGYFLFGAQEIFLAAGKNKDKWNGRRSLSQVPDDEIRRLEGVEYNSTHPETPQSPIFLTEKGLYHYLMGVRGCPKAEEYKRRVTDLIVKARLSREEKADASLPPELLAHIESQGKLLQQLSEQVSKQGEQLTELTQAGLSYLKEKQKNENVRRYNNEGEEFLHFAYVHDTERLRKLVRTEQNRTVRETSFHYDTALGQAYKDVKQYYNIDLYAHQGAHDYDSCLDAAEELHTPAEPVLLYVIDCLVWLRKSHS